MKNYQGLLLLILFALNAKAKILLPSIFSDNMVMQQNSKVAIWGKAKANAAVTMTTSWNNKKYITRSDAKGEWKLSVISTKAGGPYSIIINDGNPLVLKNILLGEVWLCSGQSNMGMPVKGYPNQPVLNSTDILLDCDNPQIRIIRYETSMSKTPQYDCTSTSWQLPNPTNVSEFSAVGYQFAQILQRKLKIPVGVIMSAVGGTRIEAWMSENSLQSFPEVKIPGLSDTSNITKNTPTVLFNAMIKPFSGYTLKGIIWYQGEANRDNPQIYDKLMGAMVSEWRQLWNSGKLPFYYVQIAPFTYKDRVGSASLLREAQAKASLQIPNSGMVVSMDVGEENSIHPRDKTTISKRLANWALANDYGMNGLPFASPVYKSHTINKNGIVISFDNAPNGLTSLNKAINAFEIAGSDKVFYPATAKVTGKGVLVQNDLVEEPVAVRYGFKDWVVGDLFNTEGLPVAPFRTDNW
ncbi:sialate O-acetylesterase [Pedobacter sp. HMF7647]|uniref:Sialate O-acetylesterase n=1 Tax=Hufsiella arboris TaxID=2695275 RepID=A0A7K1YCV3_9SPHI|nr:sialate O-acetylesterase [Hufsiella arboris]MXV51929.1 sialate O-acetylesterase [Hufsiella arboris]